MTVTYTAFKATSNQTHSRNNSTVHVLKIDKLKVTGSTYSINQLLAYMHYLQHKTVIYFYLQLRHNLIWSCDKLQPVHYHAYIKQPMWWRCSKAYVWYTSPVFSDESYYAFIFLCVWKL